MGVGVARLIGSLGCGSAVVELGFALAGVAVEVEDLPYLEAGAGRDRLLALNPLGQVPTLVLPDGTVMTESAAMMLHLDGIAPGAGLLPAVGTRDRAVALDLMMLLVASVYPTFGYGDRPEDWVGDGAAAERLRAGTAARREGLWRRVEPVVRGPFVLGDRPGAVDLYLAVMGWWSPGPGWFARETPRVAGVMRAVWGVAALGAVLERHRAALGVDAAAAGG